MDVNRIELEKIGEQVWSNEEEGMKSWRDEN